MDIEQKIKKFFLDHQELWDESSNIPHIQLDHSFKVGYTLIDALFQDADSIFREEIAKAGLHKSINQYFAVLTNLKSVGVMGDERTYDYLVALRAVVTDDFMTAKFAKIPYEVLENISKRIVNEVEHVNRIVYDITSKPPATIEWE